MSCYSFLFLVFFSPFLRAQGVESFEYKFRWNLLVTWSSWNRYRTLHARNAEVLWRRSAISAALARFRYRPPVVNLFSSVSPPRFSQYQLFIRSDFSCASTAPLQVTETLRFHGARVFRNFSVNWKSILEQTAVAVFPSQLRFLIISFPFVPIYRIWFITTRLELITVELKTGNRSRRISPKKSKWHVNEEICDVVW